MERLQTGSVVLPLQKDLSSLPLKNTSILKACFFFLSFFVVNLTQFAVCFLCLFFIFVLGFFVRLLFVCSGWPNGIQHSLNLIGQN